MKILVIGSGAREHSLCYAIKRSSLTSKLYAMPGNYGISEIAKCIDINISDNVLIVYITNDNQLYSEDYRVPINSLKKTVKIYHSACNLYFDSIKKGSIDKIEEIEKNRRNIHNEGANKLIKITESNFTMDHNTSRRMFTLLYSLYI